ncbi:MAG: RidA family protein [Sphingomonadaceae bacterium]|nr:RidA family protein [Sphingomonadaceae bacterium]
MGEPMRRPVSLIAAALAAAATVSAATPASAQVTKYPTSPPGLILQGAAVGAKSQLLFLSGQVAAPLDPSKVTTPQSMMALTPADYGDTKTQTISVLTRIKASLAEHGYTMADIVKLTVFVVGDAAHGGRMDFDGMNAGFKQFFGTADNPGTVARSTVQVSALAAPGFLVEIEAIAAK